MTSIIRIKLYYNTKVTHDCDADQEGNYDRNKGRKKAYPKELGTPKYYGITVQKRTMGLAN